jgi:hypothetical protein
MKVFASAMLTLPVIRWYYFAAFYYGPPPVAVGGA